MKQTDVYILFALIQDDKIERGDPDKSTRVGNAYLLEKELDQQEFWCGYFEPF